MVVLLKAIEGHHRAQIDGAGFAAAGVGRAGCAMPILNAGIAYVGRVNAGVTGAVESSAT